MHLCTYFDHAYLARGLVLYRSLVAHDPSVTLHVLCLDDRTFDLLGALAPIGVRRIRRSELLTAEPDLAAVQAHRSVVGFAMTCTPLLIRYVLATEPRIDSITYIDADLRFSAPPYLMTGELGNADVGVVEHRFPRDRDATGRSGRFNVGVVWFRRSATTTACLTRWALQCLDWCEPVEDGGRYGDQKYLDEWPELHPGVRVIEHPGVDLAPWNLRSHHLEPTGSDRLLVDGEPLVCFHFSRFRHLVGPYHDTGLEQFDVPRSELVLDRLYRPYARALAAARHDVARVGDRPGPTDRAPILRRARSRARIALDLALGRRDGWLVRL